METRKKLPRRVLDSSWNVMAHGYAREGKWRGNGRMEWVASTLHTTSEHGVSSITTADAHTSAVSSRLNWLRRFKWTRPFRRKTKFGFYACVITFQLASTTVVTVPYLQKMSAQFIQQTENLTRDRPCAVSKATFEARACPIFYFMRETAAKRRVNNCAPNCWRIFFCKSCSIKKIYILKKN